MDIALMLSAISTAKDLAPLLVNERDSQKAAAIKIELTEKLTNAQIQLSQVLAAVIAKDSLIHQLTEKNRELEATQREKDRYRLARVADEGIVLAYELRPAAELTERADEPFHLACQPCFDIRKNRSILQVDSDHAFATCMECKTTLRLREPPQPERLPVRSCY